MKNRILNNMTKKNIGISSAPGTCGEIVQGFYNSGTPFHVTCPISLYAKTQVEVTDHHTLQVLGLPDYASKMMDALRISAEILEVQNVSILVQHETQLETGKGMGSSTADIISVARAFASAIDKVLSPARLAQIATAIESSDGTMYQGMAAVNHKNGNLITKLPWSPELNIVMIVPDLCLDTGQALFVGKDLLSSEFDGLLKEIKIASKNRDEVAFANVALRSAFINQEYVKNKAFELLHPVFRELGAIGLNVAHTGTIAGVIFQSGKQGLTMCKDALPEIKKIVGGQCKVTQVRIENQQG
jgi:L-threonine kinase